MKYQCEGCERLVLVESFHLEDGRLAVTCRMCGAKTFAGASTSQLAPAVPASAPGASVVAQDAPPRVEEPGPRGGESAAVAVSAPEDFVRSAPARASVATLRVVRSDAPSGDVRALDGDPFQAPAGHCPKCVAPMREGAEACAQCGLVYANFIPDEQQPSEALATGWRALMDTWADWDAHDRLLSLAMGRGELAMVGRLYRLRLARAPDDAQALRGRDEVVRRVTSAVPLASDGPSPELARKVKNMVMGAVLLVALVMVLVLFQILRGSF
ncbi:MULTISPECIES: hypothetical protein [Corallococcus]|uniref:hypothetical protein n=1 Tax=Corallococcus TaxID=83461 RepID=UPI00117E14FB|nr:MULTISPECIES: hypothetical protein [Corallococcus]NBD12641.1 hypothetical protein [Corallococcus silvisoli]TSC29572.1 hypothetical protein FOF48_16905 [Corallococcus sp. Z5C101001]